MFSDKPERELVKVRRAEVEIEDHGILILNVDFEGEGWGQGLGSYCLEPGFVMRFMMALGITRLSEAKGKSCWIVHTHNKVLRVEPLHKKDGDPFDIDEWQKWASERYKDGPSPHEMRTGERPPRVRPRGK